MRSRKNDIAREKSSEFAGRVVRLYQHLSKQKQETVMSKQVLRSGTAIGASVEEAIGSQSRADFFAKMAIAYKEARKTSYWLRLLWQGDYLTDKQYESIGADADALCELLGAIRDTRVEEQAVEQVTRARGRPRTPAAKDGASVPSDDMFSGLGC
jgi:four helix bundle protein